MQRRQAGESVERRRRFKCLIQCLASFINSSHSGRAESMGAELEHGFCSGDAAVNGTFAGKTSLELVRSALKRELLFFTARIMGEM